MPEPVIVALITAGSVVVVGLLTLITEWIRRTKSSAQATEHEMHRNGGSSLRDVVDRIDRHVVVLAEHNERTARRLDTHLEHAAAESEWLRQHLDADE